MYITYVVDPSDMITAWNVTRCGEEGAENREGVDLGGGVTGLVLK